MKKRFFAIAIAMLAVCTAAKAQDKVNTLTIGFSPVGSIETHIKLKDDGEEYNYNYKSYWNANVGYERQLKGAVTLSELTFAKASFDKYDLKGTSQWFNPAQQEDITAISFTQYAGVTINPKKAVQLPVYAGLGADYLNGGPFHNLDFAVAARAKLKVYISGNFGIYVGGNFRYGLGLKSASESSASEKKSYGVSDVIWNVDAGILIGL